MSSPLNASEQIEPLPFKVDPHMLEDLGLNLYSSLPRVLAEFIANAYDADAKDAHVTIEFGRIAKQRAAMRAAWKEELRAAGGDSTGLMPLEERVLDDDTEISIQDSGHGMSREALETKFLVAGRRRRKEEQVSTTPAGRPLMGRKGLGKLAGFGVARRIEVVTKVDGEPRAHGIRLDFDEIMEVSTTAAVQVPTFRLPDDGGLGRNGTRVTLSKLVHESVKSQERTIRNAIGDHFVLIDEADFAIALNRTAAPPTPRNHAYAWPEPDRPVEELVGHSVSAEETGEQVTFDFRLRFVEDRAALRASERGVRVYAHRRLAAASSLLNADTNMHGFRMTDYLDGVVHADFLDDLDRDYIATDRQGLRWETPLLQPVYDFLSQQIKEACSKYQGFRDGMKYREVEDDVFTTQLIEAQQLSAKERKLATSICTRLASFHRRGVETDEYQEHARLLVSAVGQGEIFSAISKIANRNHPQLQDLAGEVARLTYAEIDHAVAWMRSRVVAIEALQKIVEDVDFKSGNNEEDLHQLLKGSPWLIDATYFEFLTSNQAEQTLFKRIEKKLGIGGSVPSQYDKSAPSEVESWAENRRPDLTFLLGNEGLRRIVIVELKAPNTPLHHEHLMQLRDYMRDTEAFLKDHVEGQVTVEGCLIGTLDRGVQRREVRRLEQALLEQGATTKWAVYDIAILFQRALNTHREFLEQHRRDGGSAENVI